MSVAGYLTFCAKLREVPGREVAARVDQAMKSVHIEGRRGWQIGKLSKGLRRRVGLAQALVHNPKVLILDEPTEGLDPEQIIEIRHLIQGLRGDHTVILSTHILPEAQALADRIVIIDQGKIVAVDSTENLTARVQGAQRIRVEASGPAKAVREKLQSVKGVRSVEAVDKDRALFVVESDREVDLREKLAQAVISGGWGLLELDRIEPTLEDVFLQITGRQAAAGEPAKAKPAEPPPPLDETEEGPGEEREAAEEVTV
jgi:ABC-2 type transport system ATP-binding protein